MPRSDNGLPCAILIKQVDAELVKSLGIYDTRQDNVCCNATTEQLSR
jgi:hypothetical protein